MVNVELMSRIIAFIYSIPYAFKLGEYGGNPIYIVPSSFLLSVLPLFLLSVRFNANELLLLAFFPLFFVALGLVSSIANGGDLGVIFSSFSFSIPIFHSVLGYLVGKTNVGKSISVGHFVGSIVLLVLIVFISDLVNGQFPHGCGYEGRWGGCIGNAAVYGFPNASANYLALLSIPVVYQIFKERVLSLKGILLVTSYVLIGLLSFMSLSRSSVLIYAISLLSVVFAVRGSWRGVVSVLVFVIGCIIYFSGWFEFILSGFVGRVQSTLENGDITTGRIDIWLHAWDMFSGSPFWGYAFEPFSRFSEYGTVHQQYLEILYKTGLIGFLIYFFLVGLGYKYSVTYLRLRCGGELRALYFLRVFAFALFVSNLFQPLLTYQPAGALLFFYVGLVWSRLRGISTLSLGSELSRCRGV